MPNTLGQVDPAHPRGYPTVGRAIDGPQRAIFAVFRSKPFCSRGSGEWRTVAYCTVSLAAICKQAVVGKIGKLSISNNDKYIPKMVTGHSWLCDTATNELRDPTTKSSSRFTQHASHVISWRGHEGRFHEQDGHRHRITLGHR